MSSRAKRKASSNNNEEESKNKASRRSDDEEEEEEEFNEYERTPNADATPKEILDVLDEERPQLYDDNKELRSNVVILDVRSPQEVQADGFLRVKGANTASEGVRSQCYVHWHNVDVGADDCQFLKLIAPNILHSPRTQVILHCASGIRAAKAKKVLKRMNYQRVYNAGAYSDLQYLQDSLDGKDLLESPTEIVEFWDRFPNAILLDLSTGEQDDENNNNNNDHDEEEFAKIIGDRKFIGVSGWDECSEHSVLGWLNGEKKKTPIMIITKWGRRSQKARQLIFNLDYGTGGIIRVGGYKTMRKILLEAANNKKKKPKGREEDNEDKMEIEEEEVEDSTDDRKKPAAKKRKTKEEEEKSSSGNGGGGPAFEGMVFAITGTLSMKRKDFESFLKDNGGVVKGSMTKDVTHLISARDDTAKAKKAKESGVKILTEVQVQAMVKEDRGGDDGEAEEEEEKDGDNSDKKVLDGKVFAIVGKTKMKPNDIGALIEENGGVVKGEMDRTVTHMISRMGQIPKMALDRGVESVREDKLMEMIEKGSGEEGEEDNNNNTNNKQGLDGKVFAITGALSMKRNDFVALVEENGGVVKGSVTKDVTHLISARDDTAKAKKAKESGVEIVKEEEVMEMIKGGGGGGGGGSTTTGDGPILHLFKLRTSDELADLSSGGTGWTLDGEEKIYDDTRRYQGMDAVPSNRARQLAQQLEDTLDTTSMPGGESDTVAIVAVISNLVPFGGSYDAFKKKERSKKKRLKAIEDCFLEAVGLKDQFKEHANSEWKNFDDKRDFGFCYDDGDHRDEDDEDTESNILKATGIMADSLEDCFECNFDYDEMCIAPILYGGMYDDCIVGVLGMRVAT